MNKQRKYIVLIITFITGIILGYLSSGFAVDKNLPQISGNDDKVRALENQLSDATAKLNALQQATAEQAPRLSQTAVADHQPTPVQASADSEKLKILEAEVAKQKVKEMTQWLQDGYAKSRNFEPGEVMQKKFDDEKADFGWAKEQENKLISAFSSNPNLAEFALLDTQCKSSLCQVSVSFTDMEQANKIAERFSKSIAAADQFTSVVSSPNNESKITTLYISYTDGKTTTN